MLKRLRNFVHWLVTGDGSRFFPEQKPIVPLVIKPEITVVRPVIPTEHDSLCHTTAILISGCVSRGGIPNTARDVAQAIEIHRYIREHLEKNNALPNL